MTGPQKRADGVRITPVMDYGQGASVSRLISGASNNATVAKASAGRVLAISVNNLNAAARYLKLYDKATTPAPDTDNTLLRLVIPLAPSSAVHIPYPGGIKFASGISYALVTGISDTDNTGVAASEHAVTIAYD